MSFPPHLRRVPALLTFSVAALALSVSTVLSAQLPGQLPANKPTSLPAANTLPAPIAASSAPTAPKRAEVTYSAGLLDVRANDSSLHQILRAISRETGMTITGAISDDRVFGNYGPATPATVLATLLNGTGTNILLNEGDATHPMQLVLTPRTGGASPPNPSPIEPEPAEAGIDNPNLHPEQRRQGYRNDIPAPPHGFLDQNNANANPNSNPNSQARPQTPAIPPPVSANPSIPLPANNINGSPANTSPTAATLPTTNSVPLDSLATPSTTPPAAQGIVDAPNPPAPDSTTGTSPGGVKTPDQIYQQLLQMRLQQQQQNSTTPASPHP